MKKKKIFIFSVGRSDYDRYFPIINELHVSKKTQVYLLLSKSHYLEKLGSTYKSIEKKFKTLKNNKMKSGNDLVERFSYDILYIRKNIKKYMPDMIIVLGDRYEMLAAPISAAPFRIPVIHLYGGAVTEGASLDELSRHAITKLSHSHYVLHEKYKQRIINSLGEEKWRVKTVGMHALSEMSNLKLFHKKQIEKKFNLRKKNFILITLHSETINLEQIKKHLKILFNSIKKLPFEVIITYPNADPEHIKIINYINKLKENHENFKVIKNCGRKLYYSLMKHTKLMIGNTSSGIVEAASFRKPVINLGIRQTGKIKPKNVIDCKITLKSINIALKTALSEKFTKSISRIDNPYKPKIPLKKFCKLIINTKLDKKFIRKKLY